MKKLLLSAFAVFALAACASTAKYSSGDETSQGIRIGLGSKDGIKEGDSIRAFRKDCTPNRTSRGCQTETVGNLNVIQVESERSSIAKPSSEFKLDDSIYFERDNSCKQRPLTKQDPKC